MATRQHHGTHHSDCLLCSHCLSTRLFDLMSSRGYSLWDVAYATDIPPETLDLYLAERAEWDLEDALSLWSRGVLALL